jgi:succinate dehydrogenase cytochrome b556 subunit
MGNAKLGAERPLSPHLSIYRPMLTMMMSIAHRISGAANAVGFVLLVCCFCSAGRCSTTCWAASAI